MSEKEPRKNFRLTNDEVELVKKTFNGEQDLLQALEHALLQIPMNAVELSLMQLTFKGKKELQYIIKKHILQELDDKGIAFGGTKDALMGLEIKDVFPDILVLRVKALKIFEVYLKQQFQVIEKGDYNKEQPIKLNDLAEIGQKIDSDIYIDIFARNIIIYTVQQQLLNLLGISGKKELTEEELEKQQNKDSSK